MGVIAEASGRAVPPPGWSFRRQVVPAARLVSTARLRVRRAAVSAARRGRGQGVQAPGGERTTQ